MHLVNAVNASVHPHQAVTSLVAVQVLVKPDEVLQRHLRAGSNLLERERVKRRQRTLFGRLVTKCLEKSARLRHLKHAVAVHIRSLEGGGDVPLTSKAALIYRSVGLAKAAAILQLVLPASCRLEKEICTEAKAGDEVRNAVERVARLELEVALLLLDGRHALVKHLEQAVAPLLALHVATALERLAKVPHFLLRTLDHTRVAAHVRREGKWD